MTIHVHISVERDGRNEVTFTVASAANLTPEEYVDTIRAVAYAAQASLGLDKEDRLSAKYPSDEQSSHHVPPDKGAAGA